MPERDRPERERPDPAPPEREERSYPHGTGDRNAWSPTRDEPMPVHEGGTQRKSPPAPDADGDD